MLNRGLAACVLQLTLVVSLGAAEEWWSGQQLGRHCEAFLADPESSEGALCVSFMQGYLAGADAAQQIATAYGARSSVSEGETFAERAARTRIGMRLQRQWIDAYPLYCIGEDVSARSVIEQIIAHLQQRSDDPDLTASETIHRALVHNFPCEDD